MPESDQLPPAEMEVLALLCRLGGATTRDICDGLAPHRQMGLSAAQQLLLRLEAKRLVKREKIKGRNAYRYSPTRKASKVYRGMTRSFLDRMFAGNPAQLMATLFDARELTEKELKEIRTLINNTTRKGGA